MAKEKTHDELESALRKSAERFAADIQAARTGGLSVSGRLEDLPSIEISVTRAAAVQAGQPTELTPSSPADRVETFGEPAKPEALKA